MHLTRDGSTEALAVVCFFSVSVSFYCLQNGYRAAADRDIQTNITIYVTYIAITAPSSSSKYVHRGRCARMASALT